MYGELSQLQEATSNMNEKSRDCHKVSDATGQKGDNQMEEREMRILQTATRCLP